MPFREPPESDPEVFFRRIKLPSTLRLETKVDFTLLSNPMPKESPNNTKSLCEIETL